MNKENQKSNTLIKFLGSATLAGGVAIAALIWSIYSTRSEDRTMQQQLANQATQIAKQDIQIALNAEQNRLLSERATIDAQEANIEVQLRTPFPASDGSDFALTATALFVQSNQFEATRQAIEIRQRQIEATQTAIAQITNTPESATNPLDQDLIAYYPFQGDARDQSGNGHDGLVSGASLTSDRLGTPNSAYQFDGIDDYITVFDAPDLRASPNPLTIALWFKSNRQDWNPLVSKFLNNSSKDWGTRVYENYIEFASENGTSIFADYVCKQGGVTIQSDRWYFLVVVVNEPIILYYLDGIPTVSCSNFDNQWTATAANVEIGRDGYAGHYYSGIIDDIRIYRRVLTDSEVSALYSNIDR